MGPKTVDCLFVGYAHNSNAYRFLVLKSEIPDVHTNTVIESRDATFFETIFPMKENRASTNQPTLQVEPEPTPLVVPEISNEENDSEVVPRRSKRQRIEKSFGNDFTVYLVDNVPKTLAKAYASLDADDWKEAVQSEMDSILTNGTWEICPRPMGYKPIGCKWIFKKKLQPHGTIEKYTARLVAKGFTQKKERISSIPTHQ